MTRHIYTEFLSLQVVGVIIGALLIASHLLALTKEQKAIEFLKSFPRNKPIGVVLIIINCLWALWLVNKVDLGEFQKWEKVISWGLVIGCAAFIIWVDEFLAVRATGIFLLLLACPLLDVAFLKEPLSRLLLPIICYIWIFFSFFWIGMPYLMRDHINFATKNSGRWKFLSIAGIVYGALMCVCAIFFWGSEAL